MERKSLVASALKLTMAGLLLVGCSGSKPAETTTTSTSTPTTTTETEKKTTMEKKGGQELAEGAEVHDGPVDKIVVAINSASTDVSPYAMATPSRGTVHEALYGNLFFIEPTHFIEDVQPYIGKSITKVDDKTWDIELFDNVTDSKGNPIKAQDVKFSYEYSFKNQEFLQYGTDVESFEVIDDLHLRMVTKKTVPGVIENLMRAGSITIVNQEWFEHASDEELQMDPACTGPYTVKSNVSGSEIVLVANDNYWKTDESQMNPVEYRNVKEIDLKVITEDAMRAIALENKEVDFARINSTNLHRFYDEAKGESLPGYNVWVGMTGYAYIMVFCNMDPNGGSVLSNDVNLRKAALYSFSSEDMMLAAGNTHNTATVLRSFGVQGQGGYQDKWLEDDWDYFNFSIDKAREYYNASGHKKGEVEIRMLTSISLFSDAVRSVMIENLEQAGFKVNSIAVDQALFLNYRFEPDQWDLILDYKGAGDYIVTGWDGLFNPVGYSNGSVCFTHDEKLVELLKTAQTDTNDENINAFNDYIIDQAICKALYTNMFPQVSQDGILKQQLGASGFLPSGSIYAKDYKSAPNANQH